MRGSVAAERDRTAAAILVNENVLRVSWFLDTANSWWYSLAQNFLTSLKEAQMRHRVPAAILLMAVVLAAPFFVVGQAPSGTKPFE